LQNAFFVLKHAVAVLATYLGMLAKSTVVPVVDATDDKWEELANYSLSEFSAFDLHCRAA
jgi:hypothetical protein